jgi:ATP-binding cassette subfamily B protein
MGTVIRAFWKHSVRYPFSLTLIPIFIVIAVGGSNVLVPFLSKYLIDSLGKTPGIETAKVAFGFLIFIFITKLVSNVGYRGAGFLTCFFQTRVKADIEKSSFQYLIHHSYQFFSDAFSGALVRRVNRFSSAFEDVADNVQWGMLPLFIVLIGSLAVIFTRSVWIGTAFSIWIVSFITLSVVFSTWKIKFDIDRAAKDSQATGVLSDAIANSINIKLFSGYQHEKALFSNVVEALRKARNKSWGLAELHFAIQFSVGLVVEFLVTWKSITLWQVGILSVGDFVLFQGYFLGILNRISETDRVIRRLYTAFADAKEMVEILETPHEIQDARHAKPLHVTQGKIEFQHVTFTYKKTRPVLSDFHLLVHAREKVGFVGPSGAGKSTIVKALLRFYDIDRGKILIDQQNIAKVTHESLCDQVALVPQDPVLFHRSLLDNIRYGRRDAEDAEVFEAARRAHCDEFIKGLPQGYQTLVGERGIKLSGGERQRVAIARAILKNAPILVLDEATSSLDSESEMLIQAALDELMKEKTVLAIAHRLSTIMMMDRIIVVNNGRVVDTGTHDKLLARKGIYQKLWQIQASGFGEGSS